MPQLTDKLLDLKCINYNMYIGSGHDKCDDCVDFEIALSELESFIAQELAQAREDGAREAEQKGYEKGITRVAKKCLIEKDFLSVGLVSELEELIKLTNPPKDNT